MGIDHKRSIIDYYDNTRLDYKWMWFRNGNKSVHFGFYDDEVTSHGDALIHLNRVMARKVDVKEGDIILDAGCGQGEGALWLGENFDVKIHGITLVPHQVRIAKKEAGKRNLTDCVSFSEQDYTNTRFDDESFSLIWACESMCHTLNKIDFYKEAYRLLKPGGRIICADYIRKERQLSNQNEKLLHEWLSGWSIKDLDTYQEHQINAEKIGFTAFEIEDITSYTKPSLQHLHSMANKLWKVGKVLRRIGVRNKVNHGNHLASIRQFEALEKELWYYGLLSVKKE